MKRRKMLIVITLVTIMLLNCFVPLMQVQAATIEKTTMTFNTALYKGLKAYFQEVGIDAIYNDHNHTIKMETSVIESIEGISLKEKGIEDITGLDYFNNVNKVILSANKLSEESNLAVLNNLPKLNYLDISSNSISDISEIQDLVLRLLAEDSNAVNLSSQSAKIVVDVPVSKAEEPLTYEAELPQILQFAGIASNGVIENKGILKAEWMNATRYIDTTTMPNPITSENNIFEVIVGEEGAGYSIKDGLSKLKINIKDVNVGAYNINPASKNILKDSVFSLYYVVHTEDTESVIFEDINLYNAVKEQLAVNQTVNKELASYPYNVTDEGEIEYEIYDCAFYQDGTVYCHITNSPDVKYMIENYNSPNERIKDYLTLEPVGLDYEFFNEETIEPDGTIVNKRKIKIVSPNEDKYSLYENAYDEPLVLVIEDTCLLNDIKSLILNDKEIKDLTGLEKFVALESNLNLSYNYIDTLEKIYELQINKDEMEKVLQEEYRKKVDAMASTKDKINTAYASILELIKSFDEKLTTIIATYRGMDKLKSDEEKDAATTSIMELTKSLVSEEGELTQIKKLLENPQDGINPNLSTLYTRLEKMYDTYSKEYKLTTLLIPELNYLTEEEYELTQEKLETLDGTKELAKAQIGRISTLESANALNQLEKEMIVEELNIVLDPEQEYPISYALNDMINGKEEEEAGRSYWKSIITKFEKIGILSAAANYCLIERMNNDVPEGKCFVDDYFKKQIKEYENEGIDTTFINKLIEEISNNTGGAVKEFNSYIEKMSKFNEQEISIKGASYCKGDYWKFNKINIYLLEDWITDIEMLIGEIIKDPTFLLDDEKCLSIKDRISKKIYLAAEYVENSEIKNQANEEYFNQLMVLANKFTAFDEIERYVILPDLKILDVRNNKIETLGPVELDIVEEKTEEETEEDIEATEEENEEEAETPTAYSLDSLSNLKEFYAGHNLVSGEISNVDWSKLTTLKRLDLSYNFITDILPLEVLTRLRSLDVSDNMLGGAFNLSVKNMEKLESLNLAGNQYTDINKLLVEYEMDANGKFSEYFAREDTLDLDLSRQKIEIVVEEPIVYDSSIRTCEIELPPIFSQLEAIDVPRTAFGTTSTKGTITATGECAYVPVNQTGDYQASVKVIAANGYPEDVTTSIGINTECTIKYSVKEINVDSVKINEEVSRIEKGTTQNFTATVEGTNVPDTTVTWVIQGAESENTNIDQNGLLTVAEDETATQITIIAISNYDDTIETSKTLEIFNKSITEVIVNEQNVNVEKGAVANFTANVVGENLEDADKEVTWSLENATSENTTIDENGVLTVATDEAAETIVVVATSNYDNTKSGTSTVTLFVKSVTEVVVSEDKIAKPGEKLTFTAEVKGENLEAADKGVTWSINGNLSPYTLINTAGELSIAENETAETIVVIATSKFDETKIDTAEVKLSLVKNVVVDAESNRVLHGESIKLTATVEGVNLTDADKEVTWEVSGETSEDTVITQDGTLTIGADEKAEAVIVKATSVTNPAINGTKEIEINIPVPVLGYESDNNEATITGVSPSTQVSEFKTKLLSDNEYTVIIKRDGEVVTDTENVATGDIAVIYLGDTLVEVFEIVVKGDVNADGKADALDSALIKAHRARLTTLSGVFYKAADIDENGDIAVKDARLLLYHRARIDGYIL